MQVTPAIFNYKGHELMVDAGKECRMYLMDTQSIGGDDHRTPLYRSPLLCNEDVNFAAAGHLGVACELGRFQGVRWVSLRFGGRSIRRFMRPSNTVR